MRDIGKRFFVAAMMLAFGTALFAAHPAQPTMMQLQRVDQNKGVNHFISTTGQHHNIGTVTKMNKDGQQVTVINDTVFYYTPSDLASGNLDDFMGGYIEQNTTGVGDTVVTMMTLLAPGTIQQVHTMFLSDGTANYGIWGPAWVESSTTPGSYNYNFPDPNDVDLIGVPFAVPVNVTATTTDNPQFDVWDITNSGFTVNIDSTYYLSLTSTTGFHVWVGYVTDASTGKPGIWQGATFLQDLSRSFATLHVVSGVAGSWYRIVNTNDNSYQLAHMMRIVTEHQFLPPVISNVSQLSNTFSTSKQVMADIEKIGTGSITAASIIYATYDPTTGQQNNSAEVPMSLVDGSTWAGTITAAEGDSVSYQVHATDSEGLESTSGTNYYFVKQAPTQDQTVLVIADNDAANHDSIYTAALDQLVDIPAYYNWNMTDNKGIDSSVVNYSSFNTIILFGWGAASIPMYDETDYAGYGAFLDRGGSLFFSDMDYFYAHTDASDISLTSGDFGHDYLGIGNGTSDPNDGTNGISDTELSGVDGNPLTSLWASTNYGPITYNADNWPNWGDYASASSDFSTATTVFTGSQSGEGMGVAFYNDANHSHTLFLPFAAELAPTADFDSLLVHFYKWAEPTAIENETGVPLSFDLEQNYPNPFNPTTKIHYEIPTTSQVTLTVYDLKGNVVKTLVNSKQAANRYTVEWNGTNDLGYKAASGIYLYRLSTGDKVSTKKMTLIR